MFSILANIMSASEGYLSTSGDVQYIGGFVSTSGGIQYIGGCSLHLLVLKTTFLIPGTSDPE